MIKKIVFLLILVAWGNKGFSDTPSKIGVIHLNEDGSKYMKFSFLTQMWVRYASYNTGSTYNGTPKAEGLDLGIRRFRLGFQSQVNDKTFIFGQLGLNNFQAGSDRHAGFYLIDLTADRTIVKDILTLGAGLSSWTGPSRFSAPSVGTIMGLDAPLFLQYTNDVTDQFVRKLCVFAKGYLGQLEYRVSMAQPLDIQKAGASNNPIISSRSSFSQLPAKKQMNTYVAYHLKDKEVNQTAYQTGTYLGTKKILNVGAGVTYQPDAMWHINSTSDTVSSAMLLAAVDVFYDMPIGTKGEALSVYATANHSDFGNGYLRELGAMNAANGNAHPSVLNGAGLNYPAFGTGNTLYLQVGYKLKDNLIGKSTLMPYASIQHAKYDALNEAYQFYDAGLNIFMDGHHSKLSAAYQNRPVFNATTKTINDRKGSLILQYQIGI